MSMPCEFKSDCISAGNPQVLNLPFQHSFATKIECLTNCLPLIFPLDHLTSGLLYLNTTLYNHSYEFHASMFWVTSRKAQGRDCGRVVLHVTTGQSDVRHLCKLERPATNHIQIALEQRATGCTRLERFRHAYLYLYSPEQFKKIVDIIRKVFEWCD